ncbi:MAG TPA: DNA polymerase IV [Anaerolineales bacterium]|nr:DNA polymerase IV [Anaerolineales bacterium]
MSRKVLHLDLDAFYCAVEEQRDPALRGKPFAVGGRPEERGVVSSCSYAARKFGVRSAMPMSRAVRLCPSLIVVPARHKAYGEVSRQVMERLHALTPLVEQISIDEAFLDVSDLSEPGEVIARRLQEVIRDEFGLPCSLGVAANKLVAKIASDVGKAAARSGGPPNAIQVVPSGQEVEFLAPLPVMMLWGVGPKTATRLEELGIKTMGDLARWPEADLARRFGKVGHELSRHARGLDDRPIVTTREAKSISQETTFVRDIRDGVLLRRTLRSLADQVGRRLRQEGLSGTTVKLKIRWPDFTTPTRQTTLQQPTDQDDVIYTVALKLFEQIWKTSQPVRLIGVGVSGLGPRSRQLGLWETDAARAERLQAAVDKLRERFGEQAVKRASELEDEGF